MMAGCAAEGGAESVVETPAVEGVEDLLGLDRVAALSDDTLVAAGQLPGFGDTSSLAIVHLSADGGIDPAYGVDGLVAIDDPALDSALPTAILATAGDGAVVAARLDVGGALVWVDATGAVEDAQVLDQVPVSLSARAGGGLLVGLEHGALLLDDAGSNAGSLLRADWGAAGAVRFDRRRRWSRGRRRLAARRAGRIEAARLGRVRGALGRR
jgi:hypothetical protein